MATATVTSRRAFHYIPVNEQNLLEVREGIDASFALSLAEILSSFVKDRLDDMVNSDDAMDGDIAYVCSFALDTAQALRTAAGATA